MITRAKLKCNVPMKDKPIIQKNMTSKPVAPVNQQRKAFSSMSNKENDSNITETKIEPKQAIVKSFKQAKDECMPSRPLQRKSQKENILQNIVEESHNTLPCKTLSNSFPVCTRESIRTSRTALRQTLMSEFSGLRKAVGDLDRANVGVEIMMPHYAVETMDYLIEQELTMQPLQSGFITVKDVTPRMRYILVDWLVMVNEKFKCTNDTLQLCVALLDRFIQARPDLVNKSMLQCLGVTCLLLASKFEEIYTPSINDFVYITESSTTDAQIRQLEIAVLETLDFYISVPLPITFLRRYVLLSKVPLSVANLSKYLLELTLTEYDLCHLPGHVRASAVLCLASTLLHTRSQDLGTAWTPLLQWHSGLQVAQLEGPIRILATVTYRQNCKSQFRAVMIKYSHMTRYGGASLLPEVGADSKLLKYFAGLDGS